MEYPAGDSLSSYIPALNSAELVNIGGQKAVYKADIAGREVALKVIALPPDQQSAEDDDEVDWNSAVERLRREFSILEQVDIPVLAGNGPIGLDTFSIYGSRWMYFTEDWIEGESLREMIRKGSLAPQLVARLGVDLVSAVCWLSGKGLIHRDIKPENIMWSNDRSRFVLLDPGIALDLYGPSLTRLPMLVGTMAYLSPEQMNPLQKRQLDFRSDLFSIGVVLYESATGEHPFMTVASTESQLFDSIRSGKPAALESKSEAFPGPLSAFISRCLGKRPHLRYRKCDFAKAEVQQVAATLGVEE